jgi:hypothetical protein
MWYCGLQRSTALSKPGVLVACGIQLQGSGMYQATDQWKQVQSCDFTLLFVSWPQEPQINLDVLVASMN